MSVVTSGPSLRALSTVQPAALLRRPGRVTAPTTIVSFGMLISPLMPRAFQIVTANCDAAVFQTGSESIRHLVEYGGVDALRRRITALAVRQPEIEKHQAHLERDQPGIDHRHRHPRGEILMRLMHRGRAEHEHVGAVLFDREARLLLELGENDL